MSILVRVKNEIRALPEFLRRLFAQRGQEQIELVFLDSGSTDGTLPLICSTACSVYQIAPADFSFGSSCNLLMEVSTAPICMFLSGHVLLQSDNSLEIVRSALEYEEAASVYLRQVPSTLLGSNFYERAYLARRFPAGDRAIALNNPGAFSNAASALTRKAWERVRFPDLPASEDYEWALKHLSLGGTVRYLPQVTVEHSHNESAQDVYRRVRLNVEARGAQGNPWKAGGLFLGIFGSMLCRGASLRESATYASSHARAYL
jgi:GT2 family glycosyltransferase